MHPYDGIAPKSVAIMDNCSIHHVNAVTDLFQAAGVMVVFLPPYSPDFNPIELAFKGATTWPAHARYHITLSDYTRLLSNRMRKEYYQFTCVPGIRMYVYYSKHW